MAKKSSDAAPPAIGGGKGWSGWTPQSGGLSDQVGGPSWRTPRSAPAYDANPAPDPAANAEQGWMGIPGGDRARSMEMRDYPAQVSYGEMDQPAAPNSPTAQPGPEVGLLRQLASMLRSYQ